MPEDYTEKSLSEREKIAFCELRSLARFALNVLDNAEFFQGATMEHVQMLRGRAHRALDTIGSGEISL